MVKKTFDLIIDTKRPMSNREFEVVEGDTGNVLSIDLFDDGTAVNLTGCQVIAVFANSKATVYQDSNSDDGGVTVCADSKTNRIKIALHKDSFTVGITECELQILSSSSVLVTSARFNFNSRAAIYGESSVASSSQYPLLVSLLNRTQDTVNACNEAASNANSAAAAINSFSVTVGTVTTLPASQDASVVNVGTAKNPVLNFNIPRGYDTATDRYQLLSYMTAYGNGTLNNELYLNGEPNHDSCYMIVYAIRLNGSVEQYIDGEFGDITYTDCKGFVVSVYEDSAYTKFLAGCSCTCGAVGSMSHVYYGNTLPTSSTQYQTGDIYFYVPDL